MKFLNLALVLHIIFFSTTIINAQKLELEAIGGHSYFISKNAGGYDLGIGLNYNFSKRSSIGIKVSHSYNDISHLPANLKDAKIILKEESNRVPLVSFFPDWESEKAWPQIRLDEQGNRFFRFNFVMNYKLKQPIKTIKMFDASVGIILSYRDESELIQLLETSKIQSVFFTPVENYKIPFFSYNTFFDAGFKCDFTYNFIKIRKLNIGYSSELVMYPKSGDLIINNGFKITLLP